MMWTVVRAGKMGSHAVWVGVFCGTLARLWHVRAYLWKKIRMLAGRRLGVVERVITFGDL